MAWWLWLMWLRRLGMRDDCFLRAGRSVEVVMELVFAFAFAMVLVSVESVLMLMIVC